VNSQGQICLIYIKSENMVNKSEKNRGIMWKIINKIWKNRNFHIVSTLHPPLDSEFYLVFVRSNLGTS